MPRPPSPRKFSDDLPDFSHLVPDSPLPTLPNLPLETVFALNQQTVEETVYDEAYFAESLARKNHEPFVM